MREDIDYYDYTLTNLHITTRYGGRPCSPLLQREFLDVLGRVVIYNRLEAILGEEITLPELAIERLCRSSANDSCGFDCGFSLSCSTPAPSVEARAPLLQLGFRTIASFSLTTRPRADGTGPLTDAWMWDAMGHATVRADDQDDDGSLLALYGGCADNGLTRGARQAHIAGKRMGRTLIGHIIIMFRDDDTSWMAPFIRGFTDSAAMTEEGTTDVRLFAGRTNSDFDDGNGNEELNDEIAAALEEARVRTPEVEWMCVLGG